MGWDSADIWQNHRIGWMWYRCSDLVPPSPYSLLRMFWANIDHVVTLNGHCRNKLIFGGRGFSNYWRSTQPPGCTPPDVFLSSKRKCYTDTFSRWRDDDGGSGGGGGLLLSLRSTMFYCVQFDRQLSSHGTIIVSLCRGCRQVNCCREASHISTIWDPRKFFFGLNSTFPPRNEWDLLFEAIYYKSSETLSHFKNCVILLLDMGSGFLFKAV